MARRFCCLPLSAAITLMIAVSQGHAQSPIRAPQSPCNCPHHQHQIQGMGGLRGFLFSRPAWLDEASGVFPTDPTTLPGLPRGRRYYGGRYFGSFNNRFYGPQYGYF